MKFETHDQNAFLTEGDECFSLISNGQGVAEYVCYYADVSDSVPFALNREGIQVPTEDGPAMLTYAELVTLVQAGRAITQVMGSKST